MTLKYCAEIRAIVIAHLGSYLVDIFLLLQQQYLSLLYTLSCQILERTKIQTLLKKPAQILRRQIYKLGKLRKRDILLIILIDIFYHRLKLVKLCPVLRAVL